MNFSLKFDEHIPEERKECSCSMLKHFLRLNINRQKWLILYFHSQVMHLTWKLSSLGTIRHLQPRSSMKPALWMIPCDVTSPVYGESFNICITIKLVQSLLFINKFELFLLSQKHPLLKKDWCNKLFAQSFQMMSIHV